MTIDAPLHDYAINLAAAKRKLGWDGPMRLNLACGSDVRPHFWNLDIVRQWPNSPRPCDQIWDATSNVIPFPDETVDEIVAGYLFLHVPYEHHEPLAREMFRVLKRGGRLEVGEVDMPAALGRWLLNPYDESARQMIWGEMGVVHGRELAQYDKHCSGHSEHTLRHLLALVGFTGIHRVKIHAESVWYELTMRAVKP